MKTGSTSGKYISPQPSETNEAPTEGKPIDYDKMEFARGADDFEKTETNEADYPKEFKQRIIAAIRYFKACETKDMSIEKMPLESSSAINLLVDDIKSSIERSRREERDKNFELAWKNMNNTNEIPYGKEDGEFYDGFVEGWNRASKHIAKIIRPIANKEVK